MRYRGRHDPPAARPPWPRTPPLTGPQALAFVTDFADQAVILPILAAVALALLARREWAPALSWLVLVCGVLAAMGALKILCYACGWMVPALQPDRLDVRSPSGHAASAGIVYGGLVALALARRRAGLAWTAAIALAAALLVGLTRVLLHVHSPAEVAVGAAVSLAGVLALALALRHRPPARSMAPVLACAVVAAVLFHGSHLRAESFIQHRAAGLLREWLPACKPV